MLHVISTRCFSWLAHDCALTTWDNSQRSEEIVKISNYILQCNYYYYYQYYYYYNYHFQYYYYCWRQFAAQWGDCKNLKLHRSMQLLLPILLILLLQDALQSWAPWLCTTPNHQAESSVQQTQMQIGLGKVLTDGGSSTVSRCHFVTPIARLRGFVQHISIHARQQHSTQLIPALTNHTKKKGFQVFVHWKSENADRQIEQLATQH